MGSLSLHKSVSHTKRVRKISNQKLVDPVGWLLTKKNLLFNPSSVPIVLLVVAAADNHCIPKRSNSHFAHSFCVPHSPRDHQKTRQAGEWSLSSFIFSTIVNNTPKKDTVQIARTLLWIFKHSSAYTSSFLEPIFLFVFVFCNRFKLYTLYKQFPNCSKIANCLLHGLRTITDILRFHASLGNRGCYFSAKP